MEVLAIKTPVIKEGDDVIRLLVHSLPVLHEKDLVAVTSKIVALSQGRTVSRPQREQSIRAGALEVIETSWAFLTLTGEGWCINAGADESNADGRTVLFPRRPFEVAEKIRKSLSAHFRLKHLGVLITDTRSVPLRVGTIGRAVGYAGFDPIRSYIGKPDLFGRKIKRTESNLADALAASAVMVMGEGSEQTPLALIRCAPLHFITSPLPKSKRQLALSPDRDIYAGVFKDLVPRSRKHATRRESGK